MTDNKIASIKIDGHKWWIKKIDSTHLQMAFDLETIVSHEIGTFVYHIRQFYDQPYYDDVRNWLHDKELPNKEYTQN